MVTVAVAVPDELVTVTAVAGQVFGAVIPAPPSTNASCPTVQLLTWSVKPVPVPPVTDATCGGSVV